MKEKYIQKKDNNLLIIQGRWVITGGDKSIGIIDDGAVVIHGNTVKEVGQWCVLRERYPEAEKLGSERYAVIPGLINSHQHNFGVSAVQQNVSDMAVDAWLLSLTKMRRSDPFLITSLAAARQLRAGITTVVDISETIGTPDDCLKHVEKNLQAYDQIGMRTTFAIQGPREKNRIVLGDDESFILSLPPNLQVGARKLLPTSENATWDDCFSIFEQYRQQYKNHPLIQIWIVPEGPPWVSDKTMLYIAEIAEKYDLQIQTHLLENLYEINYAKEQYKRSSVAHLKELGWLGPRVSLSHMVWVTDVEIDLLAETRTSVVHNSGSNLRLRNGIAPLKAFTNKGVNVGIGTDGLSFNDDDNIWNDMRLALRLNNSPDATISGVTPRDVFGLATNNGAKLLGGQHRLGKLAPGFLADLVLLDLDRITWPWTTPEVDPIDLIVSRASARDVDTVIVGGKIVIQSGKLMTIDEESLAKEIASNLDASPYPLELASMVDQLVPRIAKYYADWDCGHHEPYICYNSRN
jgi:cytosine/adenosine deaminase-related metal-dependent hydrolase